MTTAPAHDEGWCFETDEGKDFTHYETIFGNVVQLGDMSKMKERIEAAKAVVKVDPPTPEVENSDSSDDDMYWSDYFKMVQSMTAADVQAVAVENELRDEGKWTDEYEKAHQENPDKDKPLIGHYQAWIKEEEEQNWECEVDDEDEIDDARILQHWMLKLRESPFEFDEDDPMKRRKMDVG